MTGRCLEDEGISGRPRLENTGRLHRIHLLSGWGKSARAIHFSCGS